MHTLTNIPLIKNFFLSLLILAISLSAEVTNEYPSQKILDSKIPIVDIRTEGEWREGGILKGAIAIMFFNESGSYDLNSFLEKLNKNVDTKKPFALICRSGSRTKMLSNYLSQEYGYKIINLEGGMIAAKSLNLPTVAYK